MKNKSRVLHVTVTYFPTYSGIASFIDSCIQHTKDLGIYSEVFCLLLPQVLSQRATEYEWNGIKVNAVSKKGFRDQTWVKELSKKIEEFDVIHVHDWRVADVTLGCIRAKTKNLKLILSLHGGYQHSETKKLLKMVHTYSVVPVLFKFCDTILASSSVDFDYFKRFSNKVILVENPIDIGSFLKLSSKTPEKNILKFVYFGRINRTKRIHLLLSFIHKLKKFNVNSHLNICGGLESAKYDGYLDEIENSIVNLNLTENVKIVDSPTQKELLNIISISDISITATQYEGFGMTILESMAAGKIIVCPDISPINKFVNNKTNAFLWNPENISDKSILEFIKYWKETIKTFTLISNESRKKSICYDWKTRANDFKEIYEK